MAISNKLFATTATAALVASAIVPVASAAFNDAEQIADYAKESIDFVVERELMNGVGENNFDPKGTFTRAQAAQVIVNYLNLDTTNTESQFTDVASDKWYYDAVNAAAAAGKISGVGGGKYNPEKDLTRQDAAVIFGRLLQLNEEAADVSVLDNFNDKDEISAYAAKYVSIFVEAGVIKGKGEGFDPTGLITRQELAHIIAGAVQTDEKGELDQFKVEEVVNTLTQAFEALETAVEALPAVEEVTAENTEEAQVAVDAVEVAIEDATTALAAAEELTEEEATEYQEKIDAAQAAVDAVKVAIEEATVVEVAIDSVDAINTKTIAVSFNQPIENTNDAEFTIKKGASTLSADVTWNADKTEAHLELAGKITAGKYDITVTGLTEEALTDSVETQNETVTEVKVLTNEAPINDAADGSKEIKVAYQLLNQYGEDVTKSNLGRDLKVTASKGSPQEIQTADRGIVTLTGNYEVDDQVTVVIVDQTTGKSATGSVKVVKSAVLDTVELGDVYNAKGLELSEDNKAGQYVLISGLDQYGNEFDVTSGDVTIVSSNNEVADFTVDTVEIDDENVTALAIDVKKAGTTTLTVVSNATGKTVTKEITVAPGTKTDTIVIGDAEGTISGSKEILLPIEITNNKGELVTKLSEAKNVSVEVNEEIETDIVEKDGVLYIEFTTPSVSEGEQKTIVLTAKTETNNIVTKVLTVKPNAVATELVGLDKSVSLNVLPGQNLVIPESKFIVNDQYGDRITDASEYGIVVELGDDSTFTSETTSDTVTISPKNVELKGQTVTFTLNENEESSIQQKLTVVTASEFASYKVEDVDVIYAETSEDTAKIASGYEPTIVVKATTESGKVVTLREGTDYIISGKVNVGDVIEFANDAKEVKEAITITINATGETLTKELTYSNVEPKVTEFIFTESVVAGEAINDAKAFEGIINIDGTTATIAKLLGKVKIVTTDQYGVKDAITTADASTVITFVPEKVADVTITNNGTTGAQVKLKDDINTANVTAKVKIGNVTKDIKVKITRPSNGQ